MAGRIRRPKEHSELLEQLTSEAGNPFKSYYETLTFCAALGFAHNRRTSFEKTDEPIRWELFESNIDGVDALADMLTAASTEDVDALAPEHDDERLRTFEEYACGGLDILVAEIEKNAQNPLREVVLDLVLAEEKGNGQKPDFESLIDELADAAG